MLPLLNEPNLFLSIVGEGGVEAAGEKTPTPAKAGLPSYSETEDEDCECERSISSCSSSTISSRGLPTLAGTLGLVRMLSVTDADWTMIAGGFASDSSTTVTGCRDSRSLVEAFVSSMTPSVLAMMYDVTSYINPKSVYERDKPE